MMSRVVYYTSLFYEKQHPDVSNIIKAFCNLTSQKKSHHLMHRELYCGMIIGNHNFAAPFNMHIKYNINCC